MNLHQQYNQLVTRRHFLRRCQMGLGATALASLMGNDLLANVGTGSTAPW